MRHIIIGDVHGMATELEKLLDKVQVIATDHIIFVGDLLDKGPDSAEVVQIARRLSGRCTVTLVEGNHEEKHRRFRNHKRQQSPIAQQMKNADLMETITAQLCPDDIAFLNRAVLFYRIPEHNLLIVHGGIPGTMTLFPESLAEVQAMSNKERKKFGLIQRTRYLAADTGRFLSLGTNETGDPFWAEVYDGRFGHVVFGHEPFLDGVRHYRYATGIDTGAVFGATLTAMIIHQDGSKEYSTVQSSQSHCTTLF